MRKNDASYDMSLEKNTREIAEILRELDKQVNLGKSLDEQLSDV